MHSLQAFEQHLQKRVVETHGLTFSTFRSHGNEGAIPPPFSPTDKNEGRFSTLGVRTCSPFTRPVKDGSAVLSAPFVPSGRGWSMIGIRMSFFAGVLAVHDYGKKSCRSSNDSVSRDSSHSTILIVILCRFH